MRRLALLVWLVGCGGGERPPPALAPAPAPASAPEEVVEPPPEAVAAASPPTAPAPNPEDVAEAKVLVAKGGELYTQGRYDEAEEKLKQAMTVYPFLPDANLLLGKIFLLRASATRDLDLMNNARLMFEMARALDPQGQEVRTLLELFQREASE